MTIETTSQRQQPLIYVGVKSRARTSPTALVGNGAATDGSAQDRFVCAIDPALPETVESIGNDYGLRMDQRFESLPPTTEWEVIPCLSCGSDRKKVWKVVPDDYDPNRLVSLVQCLSCGLVFTSPRPTLVAMGKFYPDDYICVNLHLTPNAQKKTLRDRFYDYFFVMDREEKKVARLKRAMGDLGPNLNILDIGCGQGAFISLLRSKYGCRVAGVEPYSPEAPRDGTLRMFNSIEEAELLAPYDAITLWYVFEHVHDPHAVLQQCRKLLKPEGKLVFEVPNLAGWPTQFWGSFWAGFDAPRHTIHFTPSTARSILEINGWRIESLSYPVQAVGSVFALGRYLGRPWLTKTRSYCFEVFAAFALLMPIATVLSLFRTNDAILVVAESGKSQE